MWGCHEGHIVRWTYVLTTAATPSSEATYTDVRSESGAAARTNCRCRLTTSRTSRGSICESSRGLHNVSTANESSLAELDSAQAAFASTSVTSSGLFLSNLLTSRTTSFLVCAVQTTRGIWKRRKSNEQLVQRIASKYCLKSITNADNG